MPRNDAADRYSPETAAALSAGETRREATRKSDVVRIAATPRAPMNRVASSTGTTARAITGGPRRRPRSGLGALGPPQLPPRQPGQHGPRQHGDREPRQRDAEQPHLVERRGELQQQRQADEERSAGEQGRDRQAQLPGADQLGPRELGRGQPGRTGGRSAAAPERDTGLRAGHGDAARRPAPGPARHRTAHRFIGRPAARRRRTRRAWRRRAAARAARGRAAG